ncbi:tryptophan aminotransferase-related protein 2 [Amaranthus tricolor]|uniref:tryptophan aminotransferase-related protein 2 n=1 Tax=Amaranthus tricolor TaxID=29722 RepID=UPI00259063F1|nr:tryptophan aminotransferase-related protein 2 [Amaranthus tricolor]
MGKGLEKWSVRHLLMVSVALNVWLVLKLMYYERLDNFTTEQIFHGFCAEEKKAHKQMSLTTSSSMAVAVAEKAVNFFNPSSASPTNINHIDDDGRVINLDHGDPTMYESYWQQAGDKTTVLIPGWQSMSYFSDVKNLCWFLEPEFAKEVIRLHKIVRNAVTENRYIVVGTGSTQLFQAALYALTSPGGTQPISVVSATPYYSFYRQVVEYMKSGLYKWVGDVSNFDKDEPYIELITSPNNPDGFTRHPIVNRSGGMLIHDFAYYWPQYTPITSPADHDIMLFTVSKSTGHAGMRIGWALVKDEEVAKRMTKFIELNSIGVSKDSQLRAAKILQAVSDSCEHNSDTGNFFEISYNHIARRWKQLRKAVEETGMFSTPEFPTAFCKYTNQTFSTQPAFAWLKCEEHIEDCEGFLRSHNVLTRSGVHFGMSPKYVRISMLDRDSNYDLFIKRLLAMRS